jgi:hypothetical protein
LYIKGTACSYTFSENNTVLSVYDPSWDVTAIYNKVIVNDGESTKDEEVSQEINIIEDFSSNLCFKYRF